MVVSLHRHFRSAGFQPAKNQDRRLPACNPQKPTLSNPSTTQRLNKSTNQQLSPSNALQIRLRPVPTPTRPNPIQIRLRNQAPVHCRSHPPPSRTPLANPDRLHPPPQPVIHLPPPPQPPHLPPNRPSLSNRLQRIQTPLPPTLTYVNLNFNESVF